MPIDALSVLCAQLTRDLFAIVKFLFYFVEAFCHTLGRRLPPSTNSAAYQRLRVSNSPWSVAAECIALVCPSVRSTRRNQILAQNRDFCLPHLHSTPPLEAPRQNIAMTFGVKELEWCRGYPTVKRFWRYVYSFRQNTQTWQTDRRTNTQTPHDGIGHGCIASRRKNSL